MRERDFSFIQNEQIGSGLTQTPTEYELEPIGRAAEFTTGGSASALQRCAEGQINLAQNICQNTGRRQNRRRRHRWKNKYYSR
jgi:hypothetical protein